ncbi:MAG: hypothetical protein LUD72_05245 [Bacteroidales bacterium]|nr:hypothetical protein [Bacteroidales bacterium]
MDTKDIEEENIEFKEVKFNKEQGDVRGAIEEYTDHVEKMEKAIDILDGYDDFSLLKIKPSSYEHMRGDWHDYGIERTDIHSIGDNREVILNHQQNAASMFLENLRGFGLLADVVGAGKTFEAGVVLSELTYRGKVGSLLIVAISEVLASWEDVICRKFGLGINSLVVIKKEDGRFSMRDGDEGERDLGTSFNWANCIRCEGNHPVKPVLIDLDTFKYLATTSFSDNCLFDMIIVDEAHELCRIDEKDEGKNNIDAMRLLSEMIRKKKEATGEECYCLMLSATPHDGNLKGMFPLWYFICRRGGDPREFTNKSMDKHGAEYVKEYNHYNQDICFGADNISDFVRKKKIYDFQEMEVEQANRKALREQLEKDGKDIKEAFDRANEWVKEHMIDDFLAMEGNEAFREEEDTAVANAYRNVLNLIMIRQSREQIGNVTTRGKKVVNLYFCPCIPEAVERGVFEDIILEGPVSLDFRKVYSDFPDVYYPDIVSGGIRKGFFEKTYGRTGQGHYANVLRQLFHKLEEVRPDGVTGFKKMYESYYFDMMEGFLDSGGGNYADAPRSNSGQYNLFMPYAYRTPGDAYDNKVEYLFKILKKHVGDKVIIFFDYDRESNNSVTYESGDTERSLYDRVQEALEQRLGGVRQIIPIEAAGADTDRKIKSFNDIDEPSILLVKGGFTHGANLQTASVIVNFQVSTNPVDMEQKIGRIFRLGQFRDVTVYSLADVNELEGYALAYFTRIGLFAMDNGDAIILSGCNDSEMVTVRCEKCNRTAIIRKTAYDTLRNELNLGTPEHPKYLVKINENYREMYVAPLTSDGVLSDELEKIPYDEKYLDMGTELMCRARHAREDIFMMSPINNWEFVCSTDKTHKFRRTKGENDEGYECMDMTGKIMCSTPGVGNRSYYCNKLCVISQCGEHRAAFPDCGARKAFMRKEPYSACIEKCRDCREREQCERGLGSRRCMPVSDSEMMQKSVEDCMYCIEHNPAIDMNFGCRPKAHVLKFNNDWNGAECPICRATIRQKRLRTRPGELEKVPMQKFSEHISYLWDIDKAESPYFCKILENEADKVGEIAEILKKSS